MIGTMVEDVKFHLQQFLVCRVNGEFEAAGSHLTSANQKMAKISADLRKEREKNEK